MRCLAPLIAFCIATLHLNAQEAAPAAPADAGEDTAAEQVDVAAAEQDAVSESADAARERAEEQASDVPPPHWERPAVPMPEDGVANVVVIPIHEEINKTNKFILRRGIKTAIDSGAEVVVLDLDTPGGRGDVMLEMMEMLARFEGRTIAYVNDEAMSAGALISAAADDIYFAPGSVIGAAAVISGTGEDIPETLKKKIDSYMDARLRALTAEHPRRADVLRAMMQDDYVLEIDGQVIKPEGSLLSLTANEAMGLYGEPPTPLLGSGIYSDVETMMEAEYGPGHVEIREFKTTWSEDAAMFMESIAPILLGIGFLALVLEFYSPGFGLLGITGLCMLAIVFLSNFVAGLAGHEPLIFFALGFLLVMVELLLIPGIIVLAGVGLLLMLGSLIWSLADIWPAPGGGIEVDWSNVTWALGEILLGLVIAGVLFALLYRFLPKTFVWNRMVLEGAVGRIPGASLISSGADATATLPEPGTLGTAVSNLRPSGSIEIEGRRYEASVSVGSIERGEQVRVVGRRDFYLVVERVES